MEKAKEFEAEKNKLTFDMEIEQIYLAGNFSVKTDGTFEELDKNASRFTGRFVLSTPMDKITLCNIERQGFPFFAGTITVKKDFYTENKNLKLDFTKTGINVVEAKINGSYVAKKMWEPYACDISEFVKEGNNEIELTLTNNLRNMQGPFHLEEGESYRVCPDAFYKEKCIWKAQSGDWNDNYCFVSVTVATRT